MGILSGLLGNASEVDADKLQKEIGEIIVDGETVDAAYKVIRDIFVFTNKRCLIIDKQGLTGKKVKYHSIPYKSVVHFSVETSGHFDLDSELKIWISGSELPITKEFKKGSDILGVQKALASHVLK